MANNSAEKYPYVFPDFRDWSIYKLSQDREAFMKEVIDYTSAKLTNTYQNGNLSDEIAKVLYLERERIKEDPWKIDPSDDNVFWKTVKKRLMTKSLDQSAAQMDSNNQEIVRDIVERYVNEITGSFRVSTYRFAKKFLTAAFRRMLNAATGKSFKRFFGGKHEIEDKIKLVGAIDKIRHLATKGTIVLVPTHFSNLDSILIGWAADKIGLPSYSYGAGLNLYNSRFMAYFFSRLGAYTLDRRKKNSFYLESLKSFSKLSIQRGTHSLFFPGGTRSRSGSLETKLKMGLLGTVVEAQGGIYENGKDEKIFLVPLILNYHFVLEAKNLIDQYLKKTGKELYLVEKKAFGGTWNFFKFIWNFLKKSSEIVVNFGEPIDVLGNPVDDEGNSRDQFGKTLNLRDYFVSDGKIKPNVQRDAEYTKHLAREIVRRYHIENVVLTSHLVAYTAFNLFRKQNPNLNLYGLLRLPSEDLFIKKEDFLEAVDILFKRLKSLEIAGKIKLSDQLKASSNEEILSHGLKNIGAFHVKKALTVTAKGEEMITTEDMNLLYYYQNRLEGYDLASEILAEQTVF